VGADVGRIADDQDDLEGAHGLPSGRPLRQVCES
jgi:hypothetical protein